MSAARALSEAKCRSTPYRVAEPQQLLTGVVFSSPHSGRAYFSDFVEGSVLKLAQLRISEDAYVDDLFRSAISLGAPLISAVAPRAFLDLNRRPTELDPVLVEGAAEVPHSSRVAAGLGVVPRVVAEGVPIYEHRLSAAEATSRLTYWHTPYHKRLGRLLERARRTFGAALLIDCHSMPSSALSRSYRPQTAEIILGDRFGSSAPPEFVERIEAAFRSAGFSVARNAPFAGGYITERYGRPAANVSAIQIEIDRSLYLDEREVRRNAKFDSVVETLRPVIAEICGLISAQPDALAAE